MFGRAAAAGLEITDLDGMSVVEIESAALVCPIPLNTHSNWAKSKCENGSAKFKFKIENQFESYNLDLANWFDTISCLLERKCLGSTLGFRTCQ